MKRLFLIIVVLAVCLIPVTVFNARAYSCEIQPIKPIQPIGCKDLIPMCVCDKNGNCYWQWICVPY